MVSAFFELAAEFQHGHHAFEGADFAVQLGREFLVLGHGDAAPVVFHRDAAVGVDGDRDFGRESRHRLVDRVVDDFINQMVQTARGGVTDVHPGPFSDVIKVRKVFQVFVGVFLVGGGNRRKRDRVVFWFGRIRSGDVAH